MADYVIPDLTKEKEYWFDTLTEFKNKFEYFELFLDDPKYNNKWSVIETINKYCNNIVNVYSGATKIVLVSSECDWVLKIPFSDLSKDYCQIECDNYEGACKEGFGKCFAPSYPIGEFENSNCYLMKKVECNGDDSVLTSNLRDSYSNLSDEEFEEYCYNLDCTKLTVEAVAIEYGYNYEEFYNFCGRWEIDDLHNENFGIDNGHIVIVDYSGYDEWC